MSIWPTGAGTPTALANLGNLGASAPTIIDLLPPNVLVDLAVSDPRWSCDDRNCAATLSDLAGGGANETLEFTVTLTDPLPAGTASLVNTVTVSTSDIETDESNNSDEHILTIGGVGGIGPDLTVSKAGPPTASPGETIIYEMTVTTLGNVGATAPSLTDSLPSTATVNLASSDPRWTCDGNECFVTLSDLAGGGGSETLQLAVTLADPLPVGTTSVVNTVVVSTLDAETDLSNNAAEAITTIGGQGVGPDLTISKTGPDFAAPGGSLRYQITVTAIFFGGGWNPLWL